MSAVCIVLDQRTNYVFCLKYAEIKMFCRTKLNDSFLIHVVSYSLPSLDLLIILASELDFLKRENVHIPARNQKDIFLSGFLNANIFVDAGLLAQGISFLLFYGLTFIYNT